MTSMTDMTIAIKPANRYCSYQIIFQQSYEFMQTARTLEAVLQRLNEFIFLLYTTQDNNIIIPVLLIDPKQRELFNNVMHVTLADHDLKTVLTMLAGMRIYAKLKLKQHYAIPFATMPEPFPLYRILADYYFDYGKQGQQQQNQNQNQNTPTTSTTTLTPITSTATVLVFVMHARQRNERLSIASYLRKHDLARTSTFYAYADSMKAKLQSPHYHTTLLVACNDSRIALMKALTAFKVQYFSHFLKGNSIRVELEKQRFIKEVFRIPKRPIAIPYLRNPVRYPVLSSIELVSLMLPDSVRGVRTSIDGIRPYTTGRML